MDICQSDFISLIAQKATTLNLDVTNIHYETNAEYYYKNKGQFISVLNKGIPDDKLKIIFQTHIQKVQKVQNVENVEEKENMVYEYVPLVKIVKTKRYSVYVLI